MPLTAWDPDTFPSDIPPPGQFPSLLHFVRHSPLPSPPSAIYYVNHLPLTYSILIAVETVIIRNKTYGLVQFSNFRFNSREKRPRWGGKLSVGDVQGKCPTLDGVTSLRRIVYTAVHVNYICVYTQPLVASHYSINRSQPPVRL